MRGLRPLLVSMLTLWAGLPVLAQSVLSARSGVVHFFEGAVFIDDQRIEPKFGSFPTIPEASTLRTEQGRAEILLTPGCFLRLDENSAVRVVSSSLIDTRIEFLRGAAILDSLNAPSAKGVLIAFKGSEVQFSKPGLYRLDSQPAAVLQAYQGAATVSQGGKSSVIDESHLFFFAGATQTNKFNDGPNDEFYRWAQNRNQAIADENQLSADTAADPADLDSGQSIPLDPNLSLGVPNYGTPSYGGPTYVAPLGGSIFGPYNPFGYALFGTYPAYLPLVLRYPRSALYYRTHSPTGIAHWPYGTNPAWPHTGTGLSTYRPVTPRPATPAVAPRTTVGAGAAHPIIRR